MFEIKKRTIKIIKWVSTRGHRKDFEGHRFFLQNFIEESLKEIKKTVYVVRKNIEEVTTTETDYGINGHNFTC